MSPDSAADRARQRAARFSSAPQPDERPDDDRHLAPTAGAARLSRTRTTLDLSTARHRALKRWLVDAADEVGDEVTKQDALETLVGLLLTDETLARRLIAELRTRRR